MDPKLIEKVLSKSATREEARQLAAWLATDDGQDYFSKRFDRESYMLNEKIVAEWTSNEIPTDQMRFRFLSLLKSNIRTFHFKTAAAILIPFIFMLSALTFVVKRTGLLNSTEMTELVASNGEQLHIILQDGTKVQLNSASKLEFPKTFGLFKRNVKLTGEAYFSVAKESNRPFEVDLNDIKIRVTGTHFNVKAYDQDQIIKIALEEGSINITDKEHVVYPIKVGEAAHYDKKSGLCVINKVSDMTLYTAWRNRSLNFYRAPLSDIIKTLERQYEVRFSIKDSSLLHYKFSISTNRINLNDILYDLEKVSKIRFVMGKDHQYNISSIN